MILLTGITFLPPQQQLYPGGAYTSSREIEESCGVKLQRPTHTGGG